MNDRQDEYELVDFPIIQPIKDVPIIQIGKRYIPLIQPDKYEEISKNEWRFTYGKGQITVRKVDSDENTYFEETLTEVTSP